MNFEMINYSLVYDEQFANFFYLYMAGRYEEIEVLRAFYGDAWLQMMMGTLLEINQTLETKKENKRNL